MYQCLAHRLYTPFVFQDYDYRQLLLFSWSEFCRLIAPNDLYMAEYIAVRADEDYRRSDDDEATHDGGI